MVSYLLAQQGVDVLVLEQHRDFDRDFRGDTLHAGVMELLDELGLADELLTLPHAKMPQLSLRVRGEASPVVEFSTLKSKYPYVTMMPQAQFLDFMTSKARAFPSFEIQMAARAEAVVEGDLGFAIRYEQNGVEQIVDADLVIACDGRHSKMRKLLNLKPIKTSVPMDVVWLRVPGKPDDGLEPGFYVADGALLILLRREREWQIGFVILQGEFRELKRRGLEAMKSQIVSVEPLLASGMKSIEDWKSISVLKVESSALQKWHSKNVLFLGDAAHVMSPVGGVGINYAIQDAVVASKTVLQPLLAGTLSARHLAQVQRQRVWPTRAVQRFQAIMQKRIVSVALDSTRRFQLPWFMRIGFVRRLVAKFIAYGLYQVELPEGSRVARIPESA